MSALCPAAAKPGRRVAPVTVRSLVRTKHVSEVEGREWFFCDLPDSGVVCFSSDGRTLDKRALKVRVGLKEKTAPGPVCYCFRHTCCLGDVDKAVKEAFSSVAPPRWGRRSG